MIAQEIAVGAIWLSVPLWLIVYGLIKIYQLLLKLSEPPMIIEPLQYDMTSHKSYSGIAWPKPNEETK